MSDAHYRARIYGPHGGLLHDIRMTNLAELARHPMVSGEVTKSFGRPIARVEITSPVVKPKRAVLGDWGD